MRDSRNNKPYRIVMNIFRLYAKADLPKKTNSEVKSWIVSDFHSKEKDAALWNIWNNIELSYNRRAEKNAWKKINERLGVTQNKKFSLTSKQYARIAAVVIPATLLISGALWYGSKITEQPSIVETMITYTTISTEDEQRQITLSDGTEVWLNKRSSLTYGEGRRVQLDGEAHFNVKHADNEKFVVETNFLKAVVHGTSFNVHAYPDIHQTKVSLYNGKLEVQLPDTTLLVRPGEEWTINKENNLINMRTTQKSAPGWNRTYVTYDNITLDDIFRDLEKRYLVQIESEGDFLHETITLKFEESTEIKEVLFLIAEINGKFEYSTQDNIIKVYPSINNN